MLSIENCNKSHQCSLGMESITNNPDFCVCTAARFLPHHSAAEQSQRTDPASPACTARLLLTFQLASHTSSGTLMGRDQRHILHTQPANIAQLAHSHSPLVGTTQEVELFSERLTCQKARRALFWNVFYIQARGLSQQSCRNAFLLSAPCPISSWMAILRAQVLLTTHSPRFRLDHRRDCRSTT